jgi:hypothetical protein
MSTRAPVAPSKPVTRLELERFFAGAGARLGQADTKFIPPQSEVERFFSVIRHKVEPQQRRLDQKKATHFNVFDFIEPDENRLSDVLAWLLDPLGTHGQGDLFLRLMFRQLALGSSVKGTKEAKVQREAPTHGIEKYRRRMDVLVEAGGWLVIENKVDSSEQHEQVKDYLEHIHRCSGGRKSSLIYLTPNGRRPESLDYAKLAEYEQTGQLHCWSYQVELRDWLEICRHTCEAKKIKIFLADFIGYIESKLKRESEQERDNDDN